MTSEERREARYQRRVRKRKLKKINWLTKANDFDEVFSYANLYNSYRKCRSGVNHKSSTQKYITRAPLNVLTAWEALHNNKYKGPKFREFDLNERGRKRHIRSITYAERVIEKALCKGTVIPTIENQLIYDNGACQKNKGYTFAVERLTKKLREHYRKHGTDGYVLLYDFSKFYDNIEHELLKAQLSKRIYDKRIMNVCNKIIDAFGSVGIGLGCEPSHDFALLFANPLDHIIKETLRIIDFLRYMDDGWLLDVSLERIKKCVEVIKTTCDALHIKLNMKKTQIVKLSHGFKWLKMRVYLTDTGKVVKKIAKDSITRRRRMLKKLKKKLDDGVMSYADVCQSLASWLGYARQFDCYNTRKSIITLFKQIYRKEIKKYGIPKAIYAGRKPCRNRKYRFSFVHQMATTS